MVSINVVYLLRAQLLIFNGLKIMFKSLSYKKIYTQTSSKSSANNVNNINHQKLC